MGRRSPRSWTSWRLVAAIRPSARLWEDSGYTRRAQQGPSSAASQRVSPFPSAASPGLVCSAAPLPTSPSISFLTFQLVAGTLGKTKWGEGGLWVTSSYWASHCPFLSLPFLSIFPPDSHRKALSFSPSLSCCCLDIGHDKYLLLSEKYIKKK